MSSRESRVAPHEPAPPLPGEGGGLTTRDPRLATAPVLQASELVKDYTAGDGSRLRVLDRLDLEVRPGEFVAIIGASGSGKSTLLHLLGALDAPTGGEVRLEGRRYADLDSEALAALRNRKVGFVFQFHHLLRDFTAVENVMLPLLIAGGNPATARRRAEELLGRLGVVERGSHRPSQLSGGEQQRVAVARALALEPAVVLGDEPSGNLDPVNARRLHQVIAEVVRDGTRGLVVVTHNRGLAALADRVLALRNGRLEPPHGDEAMAS